MNKDNQHGGERKTKFIHFIAKQRDWTIFNAVNYLQEKVASAGFFLTIHSFLTEKKNSDNSLPKLDNLFHFVNY